MGKWRNWDKGSILTRFKVEPRAGCKSVSQSGERCRTLSSEDNVLSVTPPSQLPLKTVASFQGENAPEHTFNWNGAIHSFIHSFSECLLSIYHVPSHVSSSHLRAVKGAEN